MYDHILITTDGSDFAQKGVDQGLGLAKGLGSRVTIVTVTEPFPYKSSAVVSSGWVFGPDDIERYETGQSEHASKVLAAVKASADQLGVPADTLHVPDQHPASAIVEAASKLGCDLIVMASHGRRGISRLLLGSQTAEVLAHSKVPTLVVR